MAVTHVGSTSGTNGTATWTRTLPAGLADGDLGIAFLSFTANVVTPATPTGWTLVENVQWGAAYNFNIYQRTLAASDTTIAWSKTGTSTSKTADAVMVLRGAETVLAGTANALSLTQVTSHPVPAASVASGQPIVTVVALGMRGSSMDTAIGAIPSGTTLGTQAWGTGGAASAVVTAYDLTEDTDGSVGSGSWTTTTIQAGVRYTIGVKAATTTPPPAPSLLAVIMDSLGTSWPANDGGAATRAALVAAGWPDTSAVRVDALTSRRIAGSAVTPTTETAINTWRSGGFDPKTWVIGLGTNNRDDTETELTTKVNTVLDLIASNAATSGRTVGDPYIVHWIGFALRDTPADSRTLLFQNVLKSISTARAGTVIRLLPWDWNSYVHNGRDETGLWIGSGSDAAGLHYLTPGYTLRNNWVAALAAPDGPRFIPNPQSAAFFGT